MTNQQHYNKLSEELSLSAREYFNYLRMAMMPSVNVINNATDGDYKKAIEIAKRENPHATTYPTYAITYTLDNYDWDTADTLMVRLKKNPLDMTKAELKTMFKAITGNEHYSELLSERQTHWFIRRADDIDYDLTEGKQ